MDRLSPLDASFLHIEDDVNLMHIGSVGIFEGPPPAPNEFRTMIESKLPLVPRYRERVREVPLELGRPLWVTDPYFDLDYHVRHTALPGPGGRDELRNLVGRVMAQRLDRSKPLWELWIVENVQGDQWALVSKIHHALVDGISGTDLLSVLLDSSAESSRGSAEPWRPDKEPSDLRLVAETVKDYALSPFEQWRAARSLVRRPARLAKRIGGSVKGLPAMADWVRPRASSVLVGKIGPHRRYAWTETTLDDVKTIRTALGGSVNDVVLSAVTRGFRDLLLAHGEEVEGRTIRSLVPVSVRQEGDPEYANRVSGILAELPVGIEDPLERLASIRGQMDKLKRSGEAVAAETLTSLSGFAPPLLLALGLRVAFRSAHLASRTPIETVTTNVPGPQEPLYALGRRMLMAYPYVPLASPIRVGVAIFSYTGRLTFGLTADRDSIDDLDVLAEGVDDGIAELLAAAGQVDNVEAITADTTGTATRKKTTRKKATRKKTTGKTTGKSTGKKTTGKSTGKKTTGKSTAKRTS
jgi:diacylglycerol O-acyltransferase / wax synthase